MSDEGDMRQDLKITDNCNPSSAAAVRDLLAAAEADGERVMVGFVLYPVRAVRVISGLDSIYHPVGVGIL